MTGQGFFALVQAFFGITPAVIYLVAGLAIDSGGGPAISAGTIVAFTTLQTRLLLPDHPTAPGRGGVQTSLALFERVFEYLDLKPTSSTRRTPCASIRNAASRAKSALRGVRFSIRRARRLPGRRPTGRMVDGPTLRRPGRCRTSR